MAKGKRTKKRSRRKGIIKGISNATGKRVNRLARGTGRFVSSVPIIGKPSRKIFNDVGKLGKDTVGLAGSTTSSTIGLFANPFMKLFGTKKGRSTRRRSVKRRGSKRRGSKHIGSKTRRSKHKRSKQNE